jgi:hypothetical protein
MSGSGGNKRATRFWHQGYIIGKDSQGRQCLRFQTYSIAQKVLERAAGHGFRLAIYEDAGDWCLRLPEKGEELT